MDSKSAPPSFDASLALLAEDLLPELTEAMAHLDASDPLADGGRAIQVFIRVGDRKRAGSLLDAAMSAAVRAGRPEQVFVCHLLNSLLKQIDGDADLSRTFLEKALSLASQLHPRGNLKIFLTVVGIEVSFLVRDGVEVSAFLRDLEDTLTPESRPAFQAHLDRWRAELEILQGDLVDGESLLRPLERAAAKRPPEESTWKVLRLLGDIELSRDQTDLALATLTRAHETLQTLADRLPAEAREGYLSVFDRRQISSRLTKLRSHESTTFLRGNAVDFSRTAAFSPKVLTTFRHILEGIRDLNRQQNLGSLLDLILDAMIRFCGARRGMVVLAEDSSVRIESGRHRDGRSLEPDEMKLSRSIALQVAREGKSFIHHDAALDALSTQHSIVTLGIKSVLCVPLRVEGQTLGAIYLDDNERVGAFDPATVELAEVLADHAALAIGHARLLARVVRDGLTGASSHTFFQEQVRAGVGLAQRHGRQCSILMIDVDNFKLINDTYGHEFGNEVLRGIVETMRAGTRASDVIGTPTPTAAAAPDPANAVLGRFGGDEFEIFLPETGPEGLQVVGTKILSLVRNRAFSHKNTPVSVTLSIGGASFPSAASTADTLFRRADEALYQSKREGRNRFSMTNQTAAHKDAGLSESATDSLLLTKEGRMALGMVSRILEQGSDLEPLLRTTLVIMAQATGAERGFIVLPEQGDRRQTRLALNLDAQEVTPERLPVSFGIVDRVCESGKAVLVEDAGVDATVNTRESIQSLGVCSVLAVPLDLGPAQKGVVYLDILKGTHRFTPEDLTLLQVFGRRISSTLVRAIELTKSTERISVLEGMVQRGMTGLQERYQMQGLVARSAAMDPLREVLGMLGDSDAPVLIEGEGGSGKRMLANLIHFQGVRKAGPLIPVPCASLSGEVLGRELFGVDESTADGGGGTKKGLFELASRGALLLTDVQALSPDLQRSLLEAMDLREIRRVGSGARVRVDVRILATASPAIGEAVRTGRFRDDLHRRLTSVHLRVPPLRERIEDIPELITRLLERIATENAAPLPTLSAEAVARLQTHSWPGNVRQLETVLRRLMLLGSRTISPARVEEAIRADSPASSAPTPPAAAKRPGTSSRPVSRAKSSADGKKTDKRSR